jgi:CheY-like chemotaxis protein
MQSLKPRRKSPHPKILSDHALASSWRDSSSLPIWLSEEYYVQKIRPRLRKNKVREIFKQHGGFVTVHSEPGQGSTFRVHIPLISGVADRRATASNAKIAGGTETILVAEDHDGLQEVIRRSLESKGYTVLMARNGEEAVCLFEENWQKIALAVLDVMMPVMQGPDAYAKMCAVKPDLPVIFTTGHAAESSAEFPNWCRSDFVGHETRMPVFSQGLATEMLDAPIRDAESQIVAVKRRVVN